MMIILEGGNGAGKSTQSIRIVSELIREGAGAVRHKATDSELTTPAFDRARELGLLESQHLIYAAGLYHAAHACGQETGQGRVVCVMDRWAYSAIGRGRLRGANVKWLRGLYSELPTPDEVIVFVARPDVALERIERLREPTPHETGVDVYPQLDRRAAFGEYQARLTSLIIEEAARDLDAPPLVIDTTDRGVDDVTQVLCRIVRDRLRCGR